MKGGAAPSSARADGSSASKPSSSRRRCSNRRRPITTRCRHACNLAATPFSEADCSERAG
jgi:hypothetical protein